MPAASAGASARVSLSAATRHPLRVDPEPTRAPLPSARASLGQREVGVDTSASHLKRQPAKRLPDTPVVAADPPRCSIHSRAKIAVHYSELQFLGTLPLRTATLGTVDTDGPLNNECGN